MKKEKKTNGGARQGSGAKPKYNEQTKIVTFRCPVSRTKEFRAQVNQILKSYQNK